MQNWNWLSFVFMTVLRSLRERCYSSFEMGRWGPKILAHRWSCLTLVFRVGFFLPVDLFCEVDNLVSPGPHSLQPFSYGWNLIYLITLTGLKNRGTAISWLQVLFSFPFLFWPPVLAKPWSASDSQSKFSPTGIQSWKLKGKIFREEWRNS